MDLGCFVVLYGSWLVLVVLGVVVGCWCSLVVVCGYWWFVVVLGSSWWFSEALGCSLKLLVVLGCSWWILVIFLGRLKKTIESLIMIIPLRISQFFVNCDHLNFFLDFRFIGYSVMS